MRAQGLAGGVLLGLAAAAPAPAQTLGTGVVELLARQPRARVVVALRPPSAPATDLMRLMLEVADQREAVLSRLEPEDFRLTHQFASLAAVAGDVNRDGLLKLLDDPEVARVDLDVPVYAALAESVPLIRADQLHNQGVTGRGVAVAVLDTGIDSSHADFKDRIVAEQCFCANSDGSGCCPGGGTQQSGAGAAKDEHGHGTNVAGVIAGAGRVAPQGVAPEASLVVVRVLDKAGAASSTAQIMQALDWIATTRTDVKILNLSLATPNLFPDTCDNAASWTQAFAQAISALRSRGALTFVSSGNNAANGQIAAPACISSAVAVAAVYDANVGSVSFGCTDATTAADRVTCFSNISSRVDLLAPGGAITAAGIGGVTSTYYGTSQAAPHAAGGAALLLQAKPGLSPDQIAQALKGSGVSVTDSRTGLSFRRIDVAAALAAAP
jgi:subtilisin family serine protease